MVLMQIALAFSHFKGTQWVILNYFVRKIKYTSAFIIYQAISLKQGFKREDGEGRFVKRDAKSVLGGQGTM